MSPPIPGVNMHPAREPIETASSSRSGPADRTDKLNMQCPFHAERNLYWRCRYAMFACYCGTESMRLRQRAESGEIT